MQGGTRLENPWIYIYPLISNIVKVIEKKYNNVHINRV